jgi:hypothetical protein
VELAWSRSRDAEACLTALELKTAVRQRLGRDPFVEPSRKQIEGHVSRHGEQFIAEISVREKASSAPTASVASRSLASAATDCQELNQAIILTVTLVIDPNAPLSVNAPLGANAPLSVNAPLASSTASSRALDAPDSSSTVSSSTASRSQLTTREVRHSTPHPPSPLLAPAPTPVTRLLIAPTLAHQLLRRFTPGFVLRGEMAIAKPFEFSVAAAYFPEERQRTLNAEVGFTLTAFELAGCYRPERPIALFVCAGAWLGGAESVVHAGTPARPGTEVWSALRNDLGIAATSERLVAELRVYAFYPMTRLRYLDSGHNEIFAQSGVVPGAELGVGVRFP